MTKLSKGGWAGGIILWLVLSFLGGWGWVLGSQEPLKNPIAKAFPWPVTCTARGCVTTDAWARQGRLSAQFAASVQEEGPSETESLTTVLRRHMLEHAFVVKPVTAADARRYREEILHLKDDALLQKSVGITAEEYDRLVIIPFLQQAALQQERKAESADELYGALAQERLVIVLPFSLRWDKDTGSVVEKPSS